MGIRPELKKETYDEVMEWGQSLSNIPVTTIEDALTLILIKFRGKKR